MLVLQNHNFFSFSLTMYILDSLIEKVNIGGNRS